MTVKLNIVAQVLAFVLQGLNFASGAVPVKYQPWIAFGIAVVQAGIALLAHYQNPDGTNAKTAWIPSK